MQRKILQRTLKYHKHQDAIELLCETREKSLSNLRQNLLWSGTHLTRLERDADSLKTLIH